MVKYYDPPTKERVDNNKIDLFLKEIQEVCRKHNFSFASSGEYPELKIQNYRDGNILWLSDLILDIH